MQPSRFTLRSLLTAASLLAGLAFVPSTRAAITFQFNFTDAAGTGFNDPNHPEYKAGLIDAGQTLGSYFNNTATVTIAVDSSNDPNSGKLASCGSPLTATTSDPGFYRTVVQDKIISKGANDANGAQDDGTMSVNVGASYRYDPNAAIGVGQYDFKGTMIHELMHALGFLSLIDKNPGLAPGQYTIFDAFMSDASGSPLINPQTFVYDQNKLSVLTGGNNEPADTSSPRGEYFNGPNAKAAYYNQLVPIFSPNPYSDGSSGSHVDDNTKRTQLYMMAANVEGASMAGMRMTRVFSTGEIGILKDLGYTLSAT